MFLISSAIESVVSGDIALQSTKTGDLREATIALATSLAKFSASSGGIIEKIKSLTEAISCRSSRSTMLDRFALIFDNSLRPFSTVTTLQPVSFNTAATECPISPGLMTPIVRLLIIFTP